ncbi:MAG: 30S ribosomal protein S4 [Candidatus Gracilibacteria bacterium]|nr:30S ribosomal protein S4 [Candidatus Gracilibacteria bacterium]
MAHLIGPKCRLCRREGHKLFIKGARCNSDKCAFTRRSYAPGNHGQAFKKLTEYGRQLREKQKARRIFDIPEKQLANYYTLASSRSGDTSTNLLLLLTMRLDSVVYNLGVVESPRHARQLVTHGAFLLNGRRVDIPSIQVKPGDILELREHSKKSKVGIELAKIKAKSPAWLKFDVKTMKGEVLDFPPEESLKDLNINSQLIVEFYSR